MYTFLTTADLLTECPAPWYYDQNNDSGVCVKDASGEIVYCEDFGSIPDEAPGHVREMLIRRARTIAAWLVQWSEDHR